MSRFAVRLQQLSELLSPTLESDEASRVLSETFELMESVGKYTERGDFSTARADTYETIVDARLNSLRGGETAHTSRGILEWSAKTLAEIAEFLGNVLDYDRPGDPTATKLRSAAKLQLQEVTSAIDRESFRERSERALSEVEDAAEKAKEAAGISGSASLSEYFGSHASAELRSANVFRTLTVLAIGVAAWLAVSLERPGPDDWTALALRLALLAGVGALAAYFGRQAGQHRRMFNWARSIEVQLKSFPAFVEPLDAEVRDDIYRSFSRRVLGAPPEKGGDSGEEPLPASQVIELLTTLSKRASTSS